MREREKKKVYEGVLGEEIEKRESLLFPLIHRSSGKTARILGWPFPEAAVPLTRKWARWPRLWHMQCDVKELL